MPTERNDFYKLGDKFVTIVGDDVKVGDKAPEFTSVLPGWGTVNPLQESKGKVIILSAVPSLDTDVCDRDDHEDNEMMRPFSVFENSALDRTFCPVDPITSTCPATCTAGCY